MSDSLPWNPLKAIAAYLDEGYLARDGATAYAVWTCLLKHADIDGRCYPSFPYLCKLTNLSRATVRRALRRLAPLVQRQPGQGRGHASEYRLIIPPPIEKVSPMIPIEAEKVSPVTPFDHRKGITHDTYSPVKGITHDREKVSPMIPQLSKELSKESTSPPRARVRENEIQPKDARILNERRIMQDVRRYVEAEFNDMADQATLLHFFTACLTTLRAKDVGRVGGVTSATCLNALKTCGIEKIPPAIVVEAARRIAVKIDGAGQVDRPLEYLVNLARSLRNGKRPKSQPSQSLRYGLATNHSAWPEYGSAMGLNDEDRKQIEVALKSKEASDE